MTPFETHEVTNQAAPFSDVNLYTSDIALQEAVEREGGGAAIARLQLFGARAGSREAIEQGRLANSHPPSLHTHDANGHRSDRVEYHPSWHWLMATSMAEGVHCSDWDRLAESKMASSGANVERAGALYLAAQMEPGHCCPLSITNSALSVLGADGGVPQQWIAKTMSREYDHRFLPIEHKTAVTIGIGMTEKQGGTDVAANTTRAEKIESESGGRVYRLTGHKWFLSAPMSDAFIILAQAPNGLSCFLVPRFDPSGTPNELRLLRLKDKLGNRSNATAEIEFHGA